MDPHQTQEFIIDTAIYGKPDLPISEAGPNPEVGWSRITSYNVCYTKLLRARGTEKGGAGLGLAISKKIIDAHLGTIKVESQVGEGTTVCVRVPLAESIGSSQDPRSSSSPAIMAIIWVITGWAKRIWRTTSRCAFP